MRLIDVGGQYLGFAQTTVHRAREHHGVVAENVRQRDGRAAEEAAAEVIPLVPDRRSRDEVRAVPGVIGPEGELVRVRQGGR